MNQVGKWSLWSIVSLRTLGMPKRAMSQRAACVVSLLLVLSFTHLSWHMTLVSLYLQTFHSYNNLSFPILYSSKRKEITISPQIISFSFKSYFWKENNYTNPLYLLLSKCERLWQSRPWGECEALTGELNHFQQLELNHSGRFTV